MNAETEAVIDAAIEVQRRDIERQLKKISPGRETGSGNSAVSWPAAGTIKTLVNLFELHCGCIPARELIAEGFNIDQLEAHQLIYHSTSQHHGGGYLIGTNLQAAIKTL